MKKIIINTSNAPAPIGPYSQAVLANGVMYLSGQIPADPASGKLVEGDITAQTRQVMNNIKAILEDSGLDMASIIKTSIFLKNMDDFTKVNEEYQTYFVSNYPARETVQVARLPKDVDIEISVIALAG